MTRLILLRHGETTSNLDGRFQGSDNDHVSLTGLGHTQSRAAAEALQSLDPRLLWTSDSRRARDTADHVGQSCALTPTPDPRIREIDVGAFAGLTHAETEARFGPRPWVYANHGGESRADVAARFVPCLKEFATLVGPNDVAVVVSHSHAIRVATCVLTGWGLQAVDSLRTVPNGGWVELVADQAAWQLAAYGSVPT